MNLKKFALITASASLIISGCSSNKPKTIESCNFDQIHGESYTFYKADSGRNDSISPYWTYDTEISRNLKNHLTTKYLSELKIKDQGVVKGKYYDYQKFITSNCNIIYSEIGGDGIFGGRRNVYSQNDTESTESLIGKTITTTKYGSDQRIHNLKPGQALKVIDIDYNRPETGSGKFKILAKDNKGFDHYINSDRKLFTLYGNSDKNTINAFSLNDSRNYIWNSYKHEDPLSSEIFNIANSPSTEYTPYRKMDIGVRCSNKSRIFTVSTENFITKGNFITDIRFDSKSPIKLNMRTFSNDTTSGYTDLDERIINGLKSSQSIYVRATTFYGEYLEADFSLLGAEKTLKNSCGI